MKETTLDRRSLLKIALAGVGVPALLQVDSAAASVAATRVEAHAEPFVAPAMCPELHIADVPEASLR
jgi:hypothetical protein